MDQPNRPRPMGIDIPTGTDVASVRKRIEAMEHLLERSFHVPGTKIPVGLDSVVGLVPVIGDIVTAVMGMYMVWEAKNIGLPRWKLWRMAGNIGIDSLLGAVPVAGDAFDFLYRSNTRNLRIVKQHLDKHHPETKIIEG
ncbi:DUF4112 domain-containing protein [Altererythrobacter sp. ZODW24]|uniref:DUF4112 domain-containing protein n=1 Tax=Altererythrobacter sp. ZODW24 TaxID=2185142 RepID=UPI000DF7D53A|nr:DUF4112 domain-containing protein [Altererythrobacter sp. ZODW24]